MVRFMTDFGEMARAAKAEADAAKAKLDSDKAAADQVEKDRLEAARNFIVSKVVPLLEDAKRAFE